MIKFTHSVSLTSSIVFDKGSECAHRLIVLVPANMDFSAAPQQIGGLAHTTGMQVQLFGLCTDPAEETGLRRRLITVASLLQNDKIPVEVRVVVGMDWLNVLQTSYETGDMVVCFAEWQAGLLRKPLSQILESKLKTTVYILSNPTPQKFNANRFSQVGIWLGSLAVIAGFAILQAKIVHLSEGWLQTSLLILSLIPEFWLIWAWDGRSG